MYHITVRAGGNVKGDDEMTNNEIYDALIQIVMKRIEDSTARLAAVPKENKREKKALIIESEMYKLFLRAGFLYSARDNEAVMNTRRNITARLLEHYPHIQKYFSALDEQDKERFYYTFQAEVYMRNQIYEGYLKELHCAEAAGDETALFELRIKAGSLENVFREWEEWRRENGIFPGVFEREESCFYSEAYNPLSVEVDRLNGYCDYLDTLPEEKSRSIAEYKCAKQRLSAVSRIMMMLYHGNRVIKNGCDHIDIDNCLRDNPDYQKLYDGAPEDEKIDYKLYYGIISCIEKTVSDIKAKLQLANDWERTELEEKLGGFIYSKECLDEAWEKRI